MSKTTEVKRCEPCLGMGYKGRWKTAPKNADYRYGRIVKGKFWYVGTCPHCGGTGQKR